MSKHKSKSKKKRLAKANSSANSAPRWATIKAFGLDKAQHKTLKPQKDRHWRRNDLDE